MIVARSSPRAEKYSSSAAAQRSAVLLEPLEPRVLLSGLPVRFFPENTRDLRRYAGNRP